MHVRFGKVVPFSIGIPTGHAADVFQLAFQSHAMLKQVEYAIRSRCNASDLSREYLAANLVVGLLKHLLACCVTNRSEARRLEVDHEF